MLIDPDTGAPYTPQPSHFLGGFDIYDREETLGEKLENYNLNNRKDRKELIEIFCLPRYEKKTYRQKFLLIKCLENALSDDNYDFRLLLKHDPQKHSSFPDGWDEMETPRVLFEDIYVLANNTWKEDLRKAMKEDPSTW